MADIPEPGRAGRPARTVFPSSCSALPGLVGEDLIELAGNELVSGRDKGRPLEGDLLTAGRSSRIVGMPTGNHDSPRLAGNQQSGRDVPAGDPANPEPIQPARREVCQVDGGRTGPPHRMDVRNDREKIGDGLRLSRYMRRKADRHEGVAQAGRIGCLQRNSIELRATAAGSGKAFIGDRIINGTGQQAVTEGNRHRHTVGREAMYVVTGAIKRIDHPPQWRHLLFSLALLTNETMLGETPQQNLPDGSLGRDVGLGDEVLRAFLRNPEPPSPVTEHLTTGPGGCFGSNAELLELSRWWRGGVFCVVHSCWHWSSLAALWRPKPRLQYSAFYNMLRNKMTQTTTSTGAATRFCWQPRESTARPPGDAPGDARLLSLSVGELCGALDLHHPGRGIQLADGDDGAELLAVRLPAAPADSFVDGWVRGSDAVAIHEPRDSRRLRTTALWRLATGPAELSLELVLSNQTSAVRSDGATAVDCRLTTAEVIPGIWAGSQLEWLPAITAAGGVRLPPLPWRQVSDDAVLCLLFRRAVADRSLAVCVRRDEGRELCLRARPLPGSPQLSEFTLTAWFFPTLIEKGVLHRSRLTATLGSPADDLEWAAAAARSLAAQPPLLQ
jgi:hypothetical protein